MIDHDHLARRVVAAVGEDGARELLDVLTRSEEDRVSLIGRLYLRADGEWLADLLIALEEDEIARLHLAHALRTFLAPYCSEETYRSVGGVSWSDES